MDYAEIVLDITSKAVDKAFSYRVPDYMKEDISIGRRVIIPFGKGNKLREGYVIGLTNSINIDDSMIKNISELCDNYEIFNKNMIDLAKFMSFKYYSTMSECLQCIMPSVLEDRTIRCVYINYELENVHDILDSIIKKDNLQSKVLVYLKTKTEPIPIIDIKNALGITTSPITMLQNKKVLIPINKEIRKNVLEIDNYSKTTSMKFNEEQQKAFDFISQKIDDINKKTILINGVTGSGKTEIYMQLIEKIIRSGKEALVLVPEISLTPQTVDRFVGRFGNMVSVTHSKLSNADRLDQWKKAKDGEISIMVGARSAIFTPFRNLGIIIIDEEHESTYKSDMTPKYDAREVATKISELTGAIVVMGSATPSIESYYKTRTGEYDLVEIKNRVNNTPTNTTIVDMRRELASGNMSIFSNELFSAIDNNLRTNMQTILFLNRRGHSTFVSCRECGKSLECDNCNVNYTYHKNTNILMCHYCGKTIPLPNTCPKCGSKYIKFFGIGTQKIEDQVKKEFPNARVLRMDLDTTSKKDGHKKILDKFKNHEADILIGTQMIAKGLDFPKVSLVGVIAGDIALNTGSYKSSENCFQILTQVCGRAGRADVTGRAFIQTYNPEDYSIVLAKNNDYISFYETEIKERELNFYPPFSNIFLIVISSGNEEKVLKCITHLHKIMLYYNQRTNFNILDATKTSVYKVKNQYRYKIIIKALEETRLKNFVLYCVDVLKKSINTKDVMISLSLNPNYL